MISRHDVIQRLSNYLQGYSKSTDYYCKLHPYQLKAIERVKMLINKKLQENSLLLHINANPITLVGKLISYNLKNTGEI